MVYWYFRTFKIGGYIFLTIQNWRLNKLGVPFFPTALLFLSPFTRVQSHLYRTPAEVYSDIGKFLRFYKSGPIPKAFKAASCIRGWICSENGWETTLILNKTSQSLVKRAEMYFQNHLILLSLLDPLEINVHWMLSFPSWFAVQSDFEIMAFRISAGPLPLWAVPCHDSIASLLPGYSFSGEKTIPTKDCRNEGPNFCSWRQFDFLVIPTGVWMYHRAKSVTRPVDWSKKKNEDDLSVQVIVQWHIFCRSNSQKRNATGTPSKQVKTCLDTHDSTRRCGLMMWASQLLIIFLGLHLKRVGVISCYFPDLEWWSPSN